MPAVDAEIGPALKRFSQPDTLLTTIPSGPRNWAGRCAGLFMIARRATRATRAVAAANPQEHPGQHGFEHGCGGCGEAMSPSRDGLQSRRSHQVHQHERWRPAQERWSALDGSV